MAGNLLQKVCDVLTKGKNINGAQRAEIRDINETFDILASDLSRPLVNKNKDLFEFIMTFCCKLPSQQMTYRNAKVKLIKILMKCRFGKGIEDGRELNLRISDVLDSKTKTLANDLIFGNEKIKEFVIKLKNSITPQSLNLNFRQNDDEFIVYSMLLIELEIDIFKFVNYDFDAAYRNFCLVILNYQKHKRYENIGTIPLEITEEIKEKAALEILNGNTGDKLIFKQIYKTYLPDNIYRTLFEFKSLFDNGDCDIISILLTLENIHDLIITKNQQNKVTDLFIKYFLNVPELEEIVRKFKIYNNNKTVFFISQRRDVCTATDTRKYFNYV